MLCAFDRAWAMGNNICEMTIWKNKLTTRRYGFAARVPSSFCDKKKTPPPSDLANNNRIEQVESLSVESGCGKYKILIRTNIRIYSYQKLVRNEYPNVLASTTGIYLFPKTNFRIY